MNKYMRICFSNHEGQRLLDSVLQCRRTERKSVLGRLFSDVAVANFTFLSIFNYILLIEYFSTCI